MEAESSKCCALCQHPGCWYAESKPMKVKWPSGYTHYLAQLATRRKLCKTEEDSVDSHFHSYTVDGLPTLKVQTLTQEGISERRRYDTSPVPLERLRSQHTREAKQPLTKQPLTLPRINYAQIMLEEEGDGYSDEIVVKRVLIWRPGQRKYSITKETPTGTACAYDDKGPCFDTTSHAHDLPSGKGIEGSVASEKSPPGTVVGADQPSGIVERDGNQTKQDPTPHEATKSPLKLFKTNLTDTLPPYSERHKTNKTSASLQQWNLKRMSAPDAVSLSYLGDIDLPSQIVEEILQQLRSESTSNTDGELHVQYLTASQNKHPSRVSQKSKPASPYTVSDHLPPYNLSCKQVHNSELGVAAQHRFSQLTSFSRGLSIHPLDILKDYASHQKAKLSGQPYMVDRKNDGWKEMGDDISGHIADMVDPIMQPPLRKHQLDPLNLHATGHMTYFHTRSSRQRKRRQNSRNERLQAHSRKVARGTSNIIIPLQTMSLATQPPRTVTLKLDPNSEHSIPSHRNKDVKMTSRFISVPKSRYSPSCNRPQSYSEDALSTGDDTQLFARGKSSKLSDSHSAGSLKHPVLQHLTSPSPDYMLVAANFTEGQLILTDKEGMVTQHLTTETEESDTNIDSSMGGEEETGQTGGKQENPSKSAETCTYGQEEGASPLNVGIRAPPPSAVDETEVLGFV